MQKSSQISLSIFLFFCVTFYSCNKPPDISNFDEEAWRADKMACLNTRSGLEKKIMAVKDELKGLSQQEIVELLGRPEMQELYTRGQKFFIYYLTPAPDCRKGQNTTIDGMVRLLYIRFSALNQVNELFVKAMKQS